MITFSELSSENRFSIANILHNHEYYFAHTSIGKKKETLHEHISLVKHYALRIISVHGIEYVIDNMSKKIADSLGLDNGERFTEMVKRLFLQVIVLHDAGKVNENFQREKMNNSHFPKNILNSIESDHSLLSAIIFLAESFAQIEHLKHKCSPKEMNIHLLLTMSFAEAIRQHHQSLRKMNETLFTRKGDGIDITYLLSYLNLFESLNHYKDKVQSIVKKEIDWKNKLSDMYGNEIDIQLFILVKLCFSILTAADYLATNEYCIGLKVNDFGIIDKELKDTLYKRINEKHDYFHQQNKKNSSELNTLRLQISDSARIELLKNIEHNTFYLEAPTGSGKTHTSLILASEVLKNRPEINKMVYVFPFTTLATQTFSTIEEIFKLSEGEVAEIHSKAPFYTKRSNTEETDARYGTERKAYLDSLFSHFPISLMTHVRFFNALSSHNKEMNYLLHRLCNSVVIIDEIQSYPVDMWDSLSYFMRSYAKSLNIVFIVMSATLPKIGKLIIDTDSENDPFIPLLHDTSYFYGRESFSKRVRFNYELLETEKISIENLLLEVAQRVHSFILPHSDNKKVMVEFLTIASAARFYEMAQTSEDFQTFDILLLTGTVLEPRRKQIIKKLKSNTINKNILLVCTQVVEAGVDIDMDLGFKDISILDSEEQCAGRINRNATKKDCLLYLFRTGDAEKVYKGDLRSTNKAFKDNGKEWLEKKDFNSLYDGVLRDLKRDNSNDLMQTTFKEVHKAIYELDFPCVHTKMQLIKDDSVPVFVPLELKKTYFSTNEQQIIADCIDDDFVLGELVWSLYSDCITGTNKNFQSFTDRSASLKKLSSVLSKFTFNVNKRIARELAVYTDGGNKDDYTMYGYLYLQHYKQNSVYTFERGLHYNVSKDSNFL